MISTKDYKEKHWEILNQLSKINNSKISEIIRESNSESNQDNTNQDNTNQDNTNQNNTNQNNTNQNNTNQNNTNQCNPKGSNSQRKEDPNNSNNKSETSNKIINYKKTAYQKEAKLEIPLYLLIFVIYITFGNAIPVLIGAFYIEKILKPFYFNSSLIGGVRTWPSFWYGFIHPTAEWSKFITLITSIEGGLVFFLTPIVFIFIYLLDLYNSALTVRFIYWLLNKIRHRKELINAPPRGETADDVNIYHTRGFLLRIIKWKFSKSPFPWLTTWMFNFIKANKIGKNAVFEEHIICQEFLEMGDNTYIGQNSIVSSHLVEGQYGAITLKKVKIGNNCVIGAVNLVPPGTTMEDNSQLLPYSATLKFQKLKANGNYWGLPMSKLSRRRYYKMLKLPEELQVKKKGKSDKKNTN
ncbi:MAG: hypothetical protein ACTSU2_14315 [Promethearchaeota archaeon]